MSKRRHNFGTKRFKEKSLFIFHARIALKSLILLFVRLIARGARIGKTHRQTDRQTDRTSTVTLAHARRGLRRTWNTWSRTESACVESTTRLYNRGARGCAYTPADHRRMRLRGNVYRSSITDVKRRYTKHCNVNKMADSSGLGPGKFITLLTL